MQGKRLSKKKVVYQNRNNNAILMTKDVIIMLKTFILKIDII